MASLPLLPGWASRAQDHATAQAQPQLTAVQPGSPSQPYALKVNVQAVVLDVVATDKSGQIVKNLSKGDFQVYEDHVPQVIRSFEYSTSELPPAKLVIDSTAQLDMLARDAPVNIIVLDEINTLFEDEAFARYSLKKYLNTQGDVLPQPTMLVAVNLDHFMVLRDYTTSKDQILSALDHHLAAYPWHLKSGSWKVEQFNVAFNSLMEIAQATSGHAGHKTMIWIGRGFPTITPTALSSQSAEALKTAIETCTNALRDARVALYTLDPAGISSEPPAQDSMGFDEDDPLGGQVDFEAMAKATGGQAFHGRNDVESLIATSARDGSEFYTLSYMPTDQSGNAKSFRSIRVAMRDPNLRAATREGYYALLPTAPPAAEKADGRLSERLIFDLSAAGQGLMVYDAVPLVLVRDPANPDRFLIHLLSADVPWKQNDAHTLTADLTVLVESFDKKGKLLDRTARIATLQVPASAGGIPPKPTLTLLETISTKLPAARLRFVVRVNSNGKLGADNFFLADKRTISDPTTGLKAGGKN